MYQRDPPQVLMKTSILCLIFLIVGAAGGATLTGYLFERRHQGIYAFMFTSNLTLNAMQAEQLKLGESALVLENLEKSIPSLVTAIQENDMIRETLSADTAMKATKRFYVCTETAIPNEIVELLKPVSLPENACGVRE